MFLVISYKCYNKVEFLSCLVEALKRTQDQDSLLYNLFTAPSQDLRHKGKHLKQ